MMFGSLFIAFLEEAVPTLVGIVGTLNEGFCIVYFPVDDRV